MSKNNLSDLMKNTDTKNSLNEGIDLIDKPFLAFLRKHEAIIFDSNRIIPKPPSIISIGDASIATEGNISVILGQAKAGKSAVLGGLIAGMINGNPINIDTLGFNVRANTNSKAVIHFDTEQSNYDWHRGQMNILKRAKLHDRPNFYHSLFFRKFSVAERIEMIENTCRVINDEFAGIYCIILDGIADLVNSVNDEKECYDLVDRLEKIADKYKTAVVVVIHLNPGSLEKGRGHLGSQLTRKAESVLTVTKDKNSDVSRIKPNLFRSSGRTPTIEFSWDEKKMRHSFIGYNYSDIHREPTKKEEAVSSINDILETDAPLSFTNLKKELESRGFTESTAKRSITTAFNNGEVIKNENNYYLLPSDKDNKQTDKTEFLNDDVPF